MQGRALIMACAAASAALYPGAGFPQDRGAYPSRPVTLIVPYAPGGAFEREARLHARKLNEALNQPVVMDFKPGAGGTIGTQFVARAPADGYTLLTVTSSLTIFPAIYKDLGFDTVKDFAPISLISEKSALMVVRDSLPAKTFQEYIQYAKANPGKINIGTAGAGSAPHLAGAWMHHATGTKATFVHYKGSAPMFDLAAGRLDVVFTSFPSSLPLIKAGKARALAITTSQRSDLLPGVPTVAEFISGYNYPSWVGFLAPAATPGPIVTRLGEEFARIAKAPDVIKILEADGSTLVGNTPAQFRQVIATETAQWKKVVQDTGIKLED